MRAQHGEACPCMYTGTHTEIILCGTVEHSRGDDCVVGLIQRLTGITSIIYYTYRISSERPRIVKICELAFPLKVMLLSSPALRLVFRPTITHTQRP